VIRRLLALLLVAASLGSAEGAGTFTSGRHDKRPYALYVPSAPTDGPLVVALHGCWQTPEDFALGTRLNEAAERRGLVVVYPVQGRRDNPYRCWNWFNPVDQASTGGEAAAILAMARHVQDERAMKDRRLIVLGFSAGGFMAVNLACLAPQAVAGIGVMAGGPYRCGIGASGAMQCMRGRAGDPASSAEQCLAAAGVRSLSMRASLWQGGADAVVDAANLSALETMLARALGTVTAVTDTADGAVHSVHRDRRGSPRLESWLVRPMGHAWSGGDARGTHTFPSGPPATERMLDFLLAAGR
jgi:poly(hydroxyalkanoate) depolymerase family esterase